jgi:hypothetical protein
MTNLKGSIIELEHNKTRITKEYAGKRQPELRKIAEEELGIQLRKNIKKAVIYIEVEYE